MATTVTTPNMGIIAPVPGQDPGPDWANNQYASCFIIDSHNHSNGQGVQITPAGLNINTDLPINGNNLTLVKSVQFVNQASPLIGASPFLNTIYFSGGNLYANDGVGNQVKITSSGTVNATSSGIASGTATASFVGGVLVVNENVNTPANIQGASILIGNNVSGSNYATLQAPSALGANYSLTLPPNNSSGSTAFLTYDTSNNIGVGPSTTGGITASNIANGTLTQVLKAPMPASSTPAAGQLGISGSSGAFSTTVNASIPNHSITITTTGRPVVVGFQGDGLTTTQSFLSYNGGGGMTIEINNNMYGNLLNEIIEGYSSGGGSVPQRLPVGSIKIIDTSVIGVPGTYTYVSGVTLFGGGTASIQYCVLYAYEL